MIGQIIDILQADLGVSTLVDATDMFPIQRKQGSGLPCIVVDLLDIKTSETKHRSSDLDFGTVQVVAYAKDPRTSYQIAEAARLQLDKYENVIGEETFEIRFEDLETGVIEEDETFVTVTEYTVIVSRESSGGHT